MSLYAERLKLVLEPGIAVTTAAASHLNVPDPLRKLLPAHRRFPPLPNRWEGQLDLVHLTDIYVGVHAGRFDATRVTTVHDVIPLDHATWYPIAHARWRLSYKRSVRGLKHADLVVTPSEDARRRLLSLADLDPARVQSVPILVPDSFFPPPPDAERREGVILSLGTTAPYKNLDVLFHALTRPELRGVRVIRVGSPLDNELPALVRKLGVEARIEDLGEVTEARLIELLHTATILAQPSQDEGFGMPVSEAMATGLPVVASDGGAIPEVLGGAGRIVSIRKKGPGPTNMDDVRDYAAALAEVLEDSAERAHMAAAGIEQAERFRREPVREALLRAYATATGFAKARSGP